ncbi:unnamed protein product [Caenorhabditis brenneri]
MIRISEQFMVSTKDNFVHSRRRFKSLSSRRQSNEDTKKGKGRRNSRNVGKNQPKETNKKKITKDEIVIVKNRPGILQDHQSPVTSRSSTNQVLHEDKNHCCSLETFKEHAIKINNWFRQRQQQQHDVSTIVRISKWPFVFRSSSQSSSVKSNRFSTINTRRSANLDANQTASRVPSKATSSSNDLEYHLVKGTAEMYLQIVHKDATFLRRFNKRCAKEAPENKAKKLNNNNHAKKTSKSVNQPIKGSVNSIQKQFSKSDSQRNHVKLKLKVGSERKQQFSQRIQVSRGVARGEARIQFTTSRRRFDCNKSSEGSTQAINKIVKHSS